MDRITGLMARARTARLRVSTAGDKIVIQGPRSADSLARELLAHKPAIIEYLRQDNMHSRYKREFSGDGTKAELAEIERRVLKDGVCLAYCKVLDDFVAFYATEADKAKIPPGFVPYSDAELWELYGPDKPDLSADALRLIHAAKKTGAIVTRNMPDDECEGQPGDGR